jgi:hypothetical protein
MRLTCQKAFIPVIALTLACSEATAPPPTRVTALYVLQSIGGQPLPAIFSPRSGETATVFWATLNLDAAGNAIFAEHRRRESSSFQQERTNSRLTDYEINGETIAIGPPCPNDPLADCFPKRYGQIRDSTLTLSGEIGEPHTLIYEYRLAVSN